MCDGYNNLIKNMKIQNKLYSKLVLSILFCLTSHAEMLTSNGYSGIGILPDAYTIKSGTSITAFDSTMPGAPIISGYNTQVGLGMTDGIEIVGRLATNDQKCNMLRAGQCPIGTFRDFSSSVKWSVPIDYLKQNKISLALGVTDFGGAATYFRSYYVVATKTYEKFDLSLGQAKRRVASSILDGSFVSATWSPETWSKFSLQKVEQSTTAHALVQVPVFNDGNLATITYNHRLSDAPVMKKNWVSFGLSFPLDLTEKKSVSTRVEIDSEKNIYKELNNNIKPSDLNNALKAKGFYGTKIGYDKNGKLIILLENTSYQWNILDAAGVALGLISSAHSLENKEQDFILIISTRGINQLKISGEVKCVGLWLSKGEVCSNLTVQSLSQRSPETAFLSSSLMSALGGLDESVNWTYGSGWSFRPEIIISPTLVTAIGTEYGSFNGDMGANINAIIPLWSGAMIENNRVKPLGVSTKHFEQGGLFYASRLKPATSRTLFHQLINLPALNTQARLSAGTAYTVWDGRQIETSTQTDNGRHKLGFTEGSFKNDALSYNNGRNYRLVNYRFANNDQQTSVTEVTQGKFWAGDKGFSINQRFWHGDTTLNLYLRRTRMTETQPLVSFAGIQFAIPFTPRENKSLEHLGIRGVSQWTYSLETKVLEKDNIITGGYGEIPKVGDSLVMTFNRDRNSNRYYDTNLGRMKNAYVNLGND